MGSGTLGFEHYRWATYTGRVSVTSLLSIFFCFIASESELMCVPLSFFVVDQKSHCKAANSSLFSPILPAGYTFSF